MMSMSDYLDADDVGLATGIHWENYFGDDKERYHKDPLVGLDYRIHALATPGTAVAHGLVGTVGVE
jgi:hypothetical protein